MLREHEAQLLELLSQLLLSLIICDSLGFGKLVGDLFDLLLQVRDLHYSDHDIKERGEKPEHVVNVVKILDELGIELSKADIMEVKRMICEEVQNQSKIAENPIKNHSLLGLIVC